MHATSTRYGYSATPPGPRGLRWQRYRQGVKSAPATGHHRKSCKDRQTPSQTSYQRQAQTRSVNRISLDDIVSLAENAREVSSLQCRRAVLESAQMALRHEVVSDRSRPHSFTGPGLQALTSPMPTPPRTAQMDHIPSLVPLPSDRPFIPSPDHTHDRHTTTPTENWEEPRTPHSVSRQCCEIMGSSLCVNCRRHESRAQNRRQAEMECPRMRSAGGRSSQTFSLTQVIKRSYPRLSDDEIQDKLFRGEIAQVSLPWLPNSRREYYSDDEEDDEETEDSSVILGVTGESNDFDNESSNTNGGGGCDVTTIRVPGSNNNAGSKSRYQITRASLSVGNTFYFLARLKQCLADQTTTPLFFSDLKGMQSKILSGAVDRKAYMTPQSHPHTNNVRLKSAVSTISTASGQSGIARFGSQLSKEFMPAFVSPRKMKIIEEPKYKVYFEPPLLTKRRQIPNPSFFAGSKDEYSLPERLPDVIEFADSQRIAALEKQVRSGSALSLNSSTSEDQEKMTSLQLDKTIDEMKARPGSARSLPGQDGPISTPRTMHRVSSGGPLSARAVLEEEEEEVEEVQRSTDQEQVNVPEEKQLDKENADPQPEGEYEKHELIDRSDKMVNENENSNENPDVGEQEVEGADNEEPTDNVKEEQPSLEYEEQEGRGDIYQTDDAPESARDDKHTFENPLAGESCPVSDNEDNSVDEGNSVSTNSAKGNDDAEDCDSDSDRNDS